MKTPRLRIVLAVLALALGLAACGHKEAHPTQADANNDGDYIDAGPVTYQLQISRELNQYSPEDSQYVTGLPTGTPDPSPQQFWYGVFLRGLNQTHHDQTTLDKFEITDTAGDTFYPTPLNPSANQFAWTSQVLKPNEVEPLPNTPASFSPTQGGLLLFKLPTTVYANRPLTLYILGPANKRLGSISLNI